MASPFPVAAIGASAGGIEALEEFFRNLPAQPGCAFVIVTHLSPERPSFLPEIIARFTSLPVAFAVDGVQAAPNFAYVLPPDSIIGISDRCLIVRKPGARLRERKPIDLFFAELAVDRGEYAPNPYPPPCPVLPPATAASAVRKIVREHLRFYYPIPPSPLVSWPFQFF